MAVRLVQKSTPDEVEPDPELGYLAVNVLVAPACIVGLFGPSSG